MKRLGMVGETIEHIDRVFWRRLRDLEAEIEQVLNAVKRNPKSEIYAEVERFAHKLDQLALNWQYLIYSIYSASASNIEVKKELSDLTFNLDLLENEWQCFKEKYPIGLILL